LSSEVLITETPLRGIVAQAVVDNELVGTAMLDLDTGEIPLILVNTEHRRQGIATALIDVLETAALEAGLGSISACVAVDNEASRSLWRDLGYSEWMKYETWLGDEDD
jgi:ribosomal protein S18 acetylase RimI-like enzyme